MKLAVVTLLLLTTPAAQAFAQGAPPSQPLQEPPAPIAPPPVVPAEPQVTAPPPSMAVPAEPPRLKLVEPQIGHKRFSRFSAGPGGPLLVFSGVITGLSTGIMMGAAAGGVKSDLFYAALAGATVMGSVTSFYQYYAYTTVGGSAVDSLAAFEGFLLGFGINLLFKVNTDNKAGLWAPSIAANGAMLISMFAHTGADVTYDDALFVSSVSIYGFWLSALATGLVNVSSKNVDGRAMLIAPALGLALGGALAPFVKVPGDRMFKLDLLPIGVGAILLYVAGLTGSFNNSGPWITSIAATGVVFGLTLFFTGEPPADTASAPHASTLPLVHPALTTVQDIDRNLKPGFGFAGTF